MGRCRTKKNRCCILHTHSQWSSGLNKIPARLCTCLRYWGEGWEGDIGVIPEAFWSWRREDWNEHAYEWGREGLVPQPPCRAPAALRLPLQGPPVTQMSLALGLSMSAQINLPGPDQEIIALAFWAEQSLVCSDEATHLALKTWMYEVNYKREALWCTNNWYKYSGFSVWNTALVYCCSLPTQPEQNNWLGRTNTP